MQTKEEMAAELFRSGFNCAQSVAAVFCEKYGLKKEMALKMSSGLGSGVRSGEICGAVSGAALIIGLKYGQFLPEDKESKSNCNARTVEFVNAFRERNKSVVCREILHCDISVKDGLEQAKSKNLFRQTCTDMVKSSVAILEELGY